MISGAPAVEGVQEVGVGKAENGRHDRRQGQNEQGRLALLQDGCSICENDK